MTEHSHPQPGRSKVSPFLGFIVGIILFAVGITVLKDVAPPILVGIDFNLGKTVSWIGVLLIAFPVINALFISRLEEAIQERTVHLEATFSEAENLRAEMNKMRQEYEQRLVATEAEAREQIQAQIREAQNLRQQLMAEAVAKFGRTPQSRNSGNRAREEQGSDRASPESRRHDHQRNREADQRQYGHRSESKAR